MLPTRRFVERSIEKHDELLILVTNEAIKEYVELLTLVKKRKKKFGHVSRYSGLAKTNSTGHSERKKEEEADRRRVGK